MRRNIPTPTAAVTELPFTHHIGDFKTVIHYSLKPQMGIQAATEILGIKVRELEVRRWGGKRSVLESLKQFIQLFCTRLTVFIPPPPSSARQSQHTHKKKK